MAQRLYLPIEQVFSDLGAIGAGYKLNTYETGTTTPKTTYSDTALTSANTNPIVADSAGRLGNIFVDDLSTYKVVVTDADDVEVWSADPVDPKTFSLADFDPRPTSFWGTTAGTSTAYTLDADPDVSTYSSTQTFYFACHTDCGDSPTMAVDGLVALNLKKYDNDGSKVSLVTGDMNSGQTYHARNDGTDIVIFNPEIPANISSTTTKKGYSYLPNQITISNGTDTDHDIDFSAGNFQFLDGSGQGKMTAKTGELDAAFGTGNGMLDTGTIASDETYYLFTVYNPTTGDAKPLASLSKSSPTMTLPDADGYTELGKPIAGLRTDGSANIRNGTWLIADGVYEFSYNSPFSVNTASVGTTRTPITMNVPAGSVARFNASGGSSSGTLTRTYFTDLDGADITPSNSNGNHIMVNSSFSSTGQFQIKSNSSGAVGARSDNTSSANLYIIIEGWREYL